jgi:PIN domain nuclease of toxin-antitoxin system
VNLLLDTNALIWLSTEPEKFGQLALSLMNSENLFVSSITFTEINIKCMIGKLEFEADNDKVLLENGLTVLDFKLSHSQVIKKFPDLVRHDPFDRMLLAQAKSEGMTLITSDRVLLSMGFEFVIDSRL